MTYSIGARRPLVTLLVAAMAAVGFLAIAADRSDAAAFNRCPGYFEVENNDKISGVSFPKGDYYFAVSKYAGKQLISCKGASNQIVKFLNAGRPTSGWKMRVLGRNRPDVIFQTPIEESEAILKIKMKRITS